MWPFCLVHVHVHAYGWLYHVGIVCIVGNGARRYVRENGLSVAQVERGSSYLHMYVNVATYGTRFSLRGESGSETTCSIRCVVKFPYYSAFTCSVNAVFKFSNRMPHIFCSNAFIYPGPFRFVDSYGAGKLCDRINRFRDVYGDHFEAAPLLLDWARDPSKRCHPK